MILAAIAEQTHAPAAAPRRSRRWLAYLALGLVALLLLTAGGGYLFLRRSLPQVSGELQLKGLGAPVTVIRDERGIPHIEAQSELDLYRAQGYVTAQDRLWSMDVTRRAVAGRLAEVMGEGMLGTDKFFRTLTLRRAAEASAEILSSEAKAFLTAYAEGVNAFIDEAIAAGRLSPEFTLLGYKPEHWTIVDSLSIGKFMAYDMNGEQMENELFRYQLRQAVGDELMAQLAPVYPSDGVTIMQWSDAYATPQKSAYSAMPADDSQIDLSGLLAAAVWPQEGVGSNNWVISGRLTATGKPLLANDPHLTLRTPAIWHQSHLKVPGKLNVIGVTIPGAPGLILGHNEQIAWGMTNVDPDVLDLYIEKRNPANPYQFEYQGRWEDATVHKESIKVKGGAEVPLEIVVTRHGPIISEVGGTEGNRPQEALALKWTAHQPSREMEAVFGFNKAQNWEEFREALRLFHGPTQNFVFAAVDGTIAYHAGGIVPIRKQGDGLVPVPGWVDTYEWDSFIPFDQMPEVVNPPAGFIATANNKVVDDAYPYFLSYDWAQPYRATRITQLLRGRGQFTLDDMQSLQTDYANLQARWLLPILLPLVEKGSLTSTEQRAFTLLREWNQVDEAGLAAPLIYHTWWDHLTQLLYEIKMGGTLYQQMNDKGLITDAILREAVEGRPNDWIKAAGGLEVLAQDSFASAIADLAKRYGNDPNKWLWGNFHRIGPAHSIGAEVAALGWLFNPKSMPVSGSGITVGAMGFNRRTGDVTLAAPWRHVVDFADVLGNSKDILNPGQAGHPLSPWYASQAKGHVDGALQPMLMRPEGYEKGKRLTLKP